MLFLFIFFREIDWDNFYRFMLLARSIWFITLPQSPHDFLFCSKNGVNRILILFFIYLLINCSSLSLSLSLFHNKYSYMFIPPLKTYWSPSLFTSSTTSFQKQWRHQSHLFLFLAYESILFHTTESHGVIFMVVKFSVSIIITPTYI